MTTGIIFIEINTIKYLIVMYIEWKICQQNYVD